MFIILEIRYQVDISSFTKVTNFQCKFCFIHIFLTLSKHKILQIFTYSLPLTSLSLATFILYTLVWISCTVTQNLCHCKLFCANKTPPIPQNVDAKVNHTLNFKKLDLLISYFSKFQELWKGGISHWSGTKIFSFLAMFSIVPPLWVIFSLPLDNKYNKTPIVKFGCHLTSHIFFMTFHILTRWQCHSTLSLHHLST